MSSFFEIASRIASPWSLAAFGVAAILYLVLKKKHGKIPSFAWFAILTLVALPIIGSVYLEVVRIRQGGVYRVRVTVLDSSQTPVEDARVWSSMGGEPKKVAGGWEFNIPVESRPENGRLTIFAARPSAFLKGQAELQLSEDRNPTVILQLEKDVSATVKGKVIDVANKGIAGARVTVVGGREAVITQEGGDFQLAVNAARGEQVLLHAEKAGYVATMQWHPAGGEPAVLVLEQEGK